jgi:hypothetical protein
VKPPLPGPRLLGELFVIVAGILIALAADAWWQGRIDKELEGTYLEAFKVDLEQTIQDSRTAAATQDTIHGAMLLLSTQIARGEPLPDTLLRIFPGIIIVQESMDTYRDLVASGGTTRISSLEVRRGMSRVLQAVEYNQLAEEWALDLVTSLRASLLVLRRPVERERLSEIWAVYLDAGERLLFIKEQLAVAADSAYLVVEHELAVR